MDALKNREDGDYSSPHCRRELEEGIEETASLPENLSILLKKGTWRANPE